MDLFQTDDLEFGIVVAVIAFFGIAEHIEGGESFFGFFLAQKFVEIINQQHDVIAADGFQRAEAIEERIEVFTEIIGKMQGFGNARVKSAQGAALRAVEPGDEHMGRKNRLVFRRMNFHRLRLRRGVPPGQSGG